MRFVSKNRILWALSVLRILQGRLLVILASFPRSFPTWLVPKAVLRVVSSSTTEISLSAFQGCPWTHGMLPWLVVPLCAPHNLSSLSETSGQFLFPFFPATGQAHGRRALAPGDPALEIVPAGADGDGT